MRASAIPIAFTIEEVLGTLLSLLGVKFAWDTSVSISDGWAKYEEWAGGLRQEILDSWEKAYNADVYKELAREFDRVLDAGLTGIMTIPGNVWSALKDWATGVYDALNPPAVDPSLPAYRGEGCAFTYNRILTHNSVGYDSSAYDFSENVTRVCAYLNTSGLYVLGRIEEKYYKPYGYNYEFQHLLYKNGIYQDNRGVNNSHNDNDDIYFVYELMLLSWYTSYVVKFVHSFPIFNTREECMNYMVTGEKPESYTKPNAPTSDTEKREDVVAVDGVGKIYDRDKALGNYDVLTPGRVRTDAGAVTGDVVVDTAKQKDIAGVWAEDFPWVDFLDKIGAIPIDITEEKVIDKDDSIDDVYVPPVAPPADMGSFTANLQEIFPFCIPFDLIKAVKILTSEPVPPKYTFKIQVKQLKIDYDIVIDFAKYEDLAKIIRVLMTFAFVIMLILLTRNIIRG